MPFTVISWMTYDASTQILRVHFVSGLVYDYRDVPAHVYSEMRAASSKGSYLNQHIKGHYPFKKVK